MHGNLRMKLMCKQSLIAVIKRDPGFVAGRFEAEDQHEGRIELGKLVGLDLAKST